MRGCVSVCVLEMSEIVLSVCMWAQVWVCDCVCARVCVSEVGAS